MEELPTDELRETIVEKNRILDLIEKMGLLTERLATTYEVLSDVLKVIDTRVENKMEELSNTMRMALTEQIDGLNSILMEEKERYDKLEELINKTTIESENLRVTIHELRDSIDTLPAFETMSKALEKLTMNVKALRAMTEAMIYSSIINSLKLRNSTIEELERETGIKSKILKKFLVKMQREKKIDVLGEGKDATYSLRR